MKRLRKDRVFAAVLILAVLIAGIYFVIHRPYKVAALCDIYDQKITSIEVMSGENGRSVTITDSDYIEGFTQYLSQLKVERKVFQSKEGWKYDFSAYAGDQCQYEISFLSDSRLRINNKEYKIVTNPTVSYSSITEYPAELNLDVVFSYKEGAWDSLNLAKAGFSSREDFEEKAKEYIFKEMKMLKSNGWFKSYGENIDTLRLDIAFSSGAVSTIPTITTEDEKTISAAITIDKTAFETGKDKVAYELSHLFLNSGSYSLNEGIAQYMQDTIEQNAGSISSGISIKDYAINVFHHARASSNNEDAFVNEIELIFSNVGMTGGTYPLESASIETNQMWHILNYSFVNFLIDKYGMDAVAKLYHSQNLAEGYKALESGALESVRADWIHFLDTYESTMSYEQMMAAINNRMTH